LTFPCPGSPSSARLPGSVPFLCPLIQLLFACRGPPDRVFERSYALLRFFFFPTGSPFSRIRVFFSFCDPLPPTPAPFVRGSFASTYPVVSQAHVFAFRGLSPRWAFQRLFGSAQGSHPRRLFVRPGVFRSGLSCGGGWFFVHAP